MKGIEAGLNCCLGCRTTSDTDIYISGVFHTHVAREYYILHYIDNLSSILLFHSQFANHLSHEGIEGLMKGFFSS